MSELDAYDFHLPQELIAQTPSPNRVDARLLVVDRAAGRIEHRYIRDLPELLRAGDCLVLNNSRVLPARLIGRRALTGGHWEGLYLNSTPEGLWRLLCKSRGKLQPGEKVISLARASGDELTLHLVEKHPGGVWDARPAAQGSPPELLQKFGLVPLPPYIRRGQMVESDLERYQTVYAKRPGSIAAPTAGLHFTPRLLAQLAAAEITRQEVTLHVGLGTFRPITSQRLEDHIMHAEWGELDADTCAAVNEARESGGRVVAIGTTSVRVLESAAAGGSLQPWQGQTRLFIRPGFEFRAVDALLTNFHLPRSTLLILVRTFGGDELIRTAYEQAIEERYRFYSYGDAMLIL